jgi:hypothetical protein
MRIQRDKVGPKGSKVVRILIHVLESYDFMTLLYHVDPNPTMNLNLVESILSPDPNHRILYNIAKSRSLFMDFADYDD